MRNFFTSKAEILPNPPLLKGGEGGILASLKHRFAGILILIAVVLVALPSSTVIAQSPSYSNVHPGIRVIVHTAKPYRKVIDAIEDMGGTVSIQYQNVDALAVRLPSSGLGHLACAYRLTRPNPAQVDD